MLQIAREYIRSHEMQAAAASDAGGDGGAAAGAAGAPKPSGMLARGVQVLETLTKFVPGNLSAQTLL